MCAASSGPKWSCASPTTSRRLRSCPLITWWIWNGSAPYLGARSLRLATEAELTPLYRDCEVGAMPPLGPLFGQRVVVDKSLTLDPEIAFNAGSHSEAIRMRYGDFEELVKPSVADFGVPPRV